MGRLYLSGTNLLVAESITSPNVRMSSRFASNNSPKLPIGFSSYSILYSLLCAAIASSPRNLATNSNIARCAPFTYEFRSPANCSASPSTPKDLPPVVCNQTSSSASRSSSFVAMAVGRAINSHTPSAHTRILSKANRRRSSWFCSSRIRRFSTIVQKAARASRDIIAALRAIDQLSKYLRISAESQCSLVRDIHTVMEIIMMEISITTFQCLRNQLITVGIL